MHIFLTGDIQIGKTTIISKTIPLLNKTIGGFQTYFGEDRQLSNKKLYMCSASKPKIISKKNTIVQFRVEGSPLVYNEKFDTYGVELIQEAKKNSDLIIMDECGSLERQAALFQDEIFDTLNGDIPALGVVKQDSWGWTDYIRNHQNVKLITVTKENRNKLPGFVANYILKYGHCAELYHEHKNLRAAGGNQNDK